MEMVDHRDRAETAYVTRSPVLGHTLECNFATGKGPMKPSNRVGLAIRDVELLLFENLVDEALLGHR
jgi:hypothetical protein